MYQFAKFTPEAVFVKTKEHKKLFQATFTPERN